MKLALNCARVAGPEILDRAAAKGLARVLDLPGPAARCWAAAAAFAKADAGARVVARVGYFAAQDDRIAHSLAADRVAAEVERCAELLGRPLDAALLHGPEVLLLDEPFEGIDPITVRVIKDMLLGLSRKGTTLVLTSHALDLVEKLCPVLAIIDQGKLVASGSLEQLQEMHGESDGLEALFIELMGGGRGGELSW